MAVPPLPLSEELEAGNPESLRKQPQHNPGRVRAKLCSTSEYLHSLPGKGRQKSKEKTKTERYTGQEKTEKEREEEGEREETYTHSTTETGWRREMGKDGKTQRGRQRSTGNRDRKPERKEDGEL